MKRMSILLSLLFFSLFTATWLQAQSQVKKLPQIVTFDPPGSGTGAYQGTNVAAINPSGLITGWYIDDNNQSWGFLRTASGTITTFSVPNAGTGINLGTGPSAINPQGTTAGYYVDANCFPHGFIRTAAGKTMEIDAPGAGTSPGGCFNFDPLGTQGTIVWDINAAGETAGVVQDANDILHAFVRSANGQITVFDAPGASTDLFRGTFPVMGTGLNSAGTVVGPFYDPNNAYHGWLRMRDGTITTFDAPGAGTDAFQGTYPLSINTAGQIVGTYMDINSVQHGFVRSPNGAIKTIDVPGCGTEAGQGTSVNVNNDAGIMAGSCTDINNIFHAFVRSAQGKITTFDAPGAGTDAYEGTFPIGITPNGEIVGIYIDSNYAYHGFVRAADPCD